MSLTKAQKKKFNALADESGSRDQMTRIRARLYLNKFVMKHGEAACKEAFDEENERRRKLYRK
jgi:hypothetical protein